MRSKPKNKDRRRSKSSSKPTVDGFRGDSNSKKSRKKFGESSSKSFSSRFNQRSNKNNHSDDFTPRSGIGPCTSVFQDKALEKAIEGTKSFLQKMLPTKEAQVVSADLKAEKKHFSELDFTLDPWQQEAYQYLMQGRDLLVDAPTTAGKTRVVEAFFKDNIHKPGFRAAYTTPVKSLSNDKVRELREMFGTENVGIATGDIKENLGAPIVVATLECYRNSLLGTEPDLGRNLVVFDEYHFLQDESRGSAWEESIILSPPSCQLLLLSASVENVPEFMAWLQKIRPTRTTEVVRVLHRPVPLMDLIFSDGEWILKSEFPEKILEDAKRRASKHWEFPVKPEYLVQRLKKLQDLDLLPCMVYVGRRVACEKLAMTIMKSMEPLSLEESEEIGEILQKLHKEKKVLSFLNPALRRSIQTYGVAYHHSGLAIPARFAVESLVKRGKLRYCVATMGLSVGINFAVRSACISDYERPGEQGFTLYPPSEVLQMLGRAGRRGRDKLGFSLWPSIDAFARLGGAVREKCSSRLRNDPATFLGLIGRGFSLKDLELFYEKSFRRFQQSNTDFALARSERVLSKLKVETLPCISPAYEIAAFICADSAESKPSHASLCHACNLRSKCHPYLEHKLGGSLAALHVHLHILGCLNAEENLTACGDVAKYLPQAGGLLLAQYIVDGKIDVDNLDHAAELMGALSLARFKEPQTMQSYRFPFAEKTIEKELLRCYPETLFPELYDTANQNRNREQAQIREFNPAAGSIIRLWLSGVSWPELMEQSSSDNFGAGDVMAVIYRVSTYLQSIVQLGHGDLSKRARELRDKLLREPLSFGL